ncbi:uncharacterized protein LOC142203043 [Leptodactylus fuscus]|uniref:uncharacterized protein LOC142203043 n=1 Tax=Leptodactylus fuscus TaxID=238119 RepID=UPI003F4E49D1
MGLIRVFVRNKVVDSVDMDLFTDAAGSVGFGAYCQVEEISRVGPGGGGGWRSFPGGLMGPALRAANGLIEASLARGTWVAYSTAWRQWENWVQSFQGLGLSDEGLLFLLIGQGKEEGWSVSKVNRLLAGLAFGFKLRNRQDITKSFVVQQAVKGWRRGWESRDQRRPVSFLMLVEIGGLLEGVCSSAGEVRLFKLAFSLAFFAALRIGELVSPSVSRPGGLLSEDIELFTDGLEFRIRRSKTDQAGKGAKVILFGIPECIMCPVRCLRDYLPSVRMSGIPLLRHATGDNLSRFQFVAVFRKCVVASGREPKEFGSHSFRIGAATEAARHGLGEDVVRKIGRWESIRFRSYLRPGWLN